MERPRAPITAGAAGVALFLTELARGAGSALRKRVSEEALPWVNAALRTLRHPRTACGFPHPSFPRSWDGLGVFQGGAGVHAVAARVASVRGDSCAFGAAASRFVNASKAARTREDLPTEAFYGCAGFVHAVRDFEAQAIALGLEPREDVRSVGREAHQQVYESLVRTARRPLPQHRRLGYAHGLAGELDAVLAWDPCPSMVVAAVLDQLLAHAVVEDNLVAWPVSVGADPGGPLWPSWCNGVAGHVYLWCRAYEVFREERYLTAARLAAHTTAVLHPRHPSVCCGTAGQAFALHRYFRLTGDPAYRRLAFARARRACAQAVSGRELSLGYFTGLSGIAHLALTIHARQTPCLPLVDSLSRSDHLGLDPSNRDMQPSIPASVRR